MRIHIIVGDVGQSRTAAIVLQVDGNLCVLGGGAWNAVKQAMPPEERKELMDNFDDDVRALQPIPPGDARVLPLPAGVPWDWAIVTAATLHDADGHQPDQKVMQAVLAKPSADLLAQVRQRGFDLVLRS